MAIRLFDQLNQEWSRTTRSIEAERSLHRWCRAQPELGRFDGLEALIGGIQTKDRDQTDRLLRALLETGNEDVLAHRVVLQALMPGLVSGVLRLIPGPFTKNELASAFVGAGWEKIREYPLDRRPRSIAANIVFDCRRAVDRSLFRSVAHETPDGELTSRMSCPRESISWVQANALLESAVRSKVISAEDARLISLSRLHDVPVAELAPVYGIQAHSLRRRRLRAEAAIAATVA